MSKRRKPIFLQAEFIFIQSRHLNYLVGVLIQLDFESLTIGLTKEKKTNFEKQ